MLGLDDRGESYVMPDNTSEAQAWSVQFVSTWGESHHDG